MSENYLYQNLMLTDKQNKIFSILKNTSDSLILKKGDQKFIRKSFILEESCLSQLVKRQNMSHNNLINLYQIEFSHVISQGRFAVEMLIEHYCRSLEQCLISEQLSWQDEQIINTFEPIIQVIDYLIKQKLPLNGFSFKNIIITQAQDIKFIDNFLFQKQTSLSFYSKDINNFNQLKIYETIADKIFNLIFPRQSSKIWKSRVKLIKEKCSKQLYTFIYSIISKSSSKGYDSGKCKKIKKSQTSKKKQNIEEAINKCHQKQKSQKDNQQYCKSNLNGKHQGKQNKAQQ